MEVVLPDTIISDDVAKCLKEYAENIVCKDNTDYVWEVRYVIGKE